MGAVPEEISEPLEGFSTLAAQFTRSVLDRILSTVKKLREQGWPERRILARMRQDLKLYPSHAVQRLYDLSCNKEISDDIAPSNLVSEKEVKKDALDVAVRVLIPGIERGGLLQHRASCWYVVDVRGTTYGLKKLT